MAGLCDLRIDQVTFPGAHNAGAGFNGNLWYRDVTWGNWPAIACAYRNVDRNFFDMLNHGIRFFDIDTCLWRGQVESCHNNAYAGPLRKAFDQIDDYMKCHKNEVIILHFNRDVSGDRATVAKKLIAELEKRWNPNKANNQVKMSTHPRWPTLRQAIETKQRIFIFMDRNLARYVSKSYIYERNKFMASTWESGITVGLGKSGCDGIIGPARRKCDKYSKKEIIELSAFGSHGLCIHDMAKQCSLALKEAADECYKQREKRGKTVNVLLVDYPVSSYYSNKGVVDTAKTLNEKNVKKFSG